MNVDFVDRWSLAHVSFGMTQLYGLLLLSRRKWWMWLVAVVIGFAWEMLENNQWFKSKLRGWGFPDYYGDSGRNMNADQAFNLLGFAMAWYGPNWFVLLPWLNEVGMYLFWGDSTTLAILRALKN